MYQDERFFEKNADVELYEDQVPPKSGSSGKILPPQCAQSSPWPDVACPKSKPSAELQTLRINRLRDVIWEGIQTTNKHDPRSRDRGVFGRSFDWHSCVHAHWALLAIARTRKDATLEAQVTARLSAKAILAERTFLSKHEDVASLPYGRAWMLLLLSELARRSLIATAILTFQSELENAMLKWLEDSKYPESGTVSSPAFTAQHSSWLFAYLLVVLSQPKSATALSRLRALSKSRIEPQRAALAKVTHQPSDFLYLPAVQAMIDRVDPAAAARPAYPVGVSQPLANPPLDDTNAHSAGAAMVRIWPHAIDAAAGDKAACARFHTRMNEMFSRTDQWADSFELVAHWVPQFMWMALWLGDGRP